MCGDDCDNNDDDDDGDDDDFGGDNDFGGDDDDLGGDDDDFGGVAVGWKMTELEEGHLSYAAAPTFQ